MNLNKTDPTAPTARDLRSLKSITGCLKRYNIITGQPIHVPAVFHVKDVASPGLFALRKSSNGDTLYTLCELFAHAEYIHVHRKGDRSTIIEHIKGLTDEFSSTFNIDHAGVKTNAANIVLEQQL